MAQETEGLVLTPMTDEEKSLMFGGVQAAAPAPADITGDKPADQIPDAGKVVVDFDIASFNKKFGTTFEKDDAVLEVLSKGTKLTELELAHAESEKRITELTERSKKAINPLEYFSSKDAYLREQLLLKNKDKADSVKYLSELSPGKIDSMADYDALKLSLLVNNPELDGGDAGAVELLNEKYNFDGDFETAERSTKNRILLDAKEARKSLKSLFEGIEIPDVQDWESKIQSTRDGWRVPAKELVDGISELQLSEDYSFTVDPSSKASLYEEVLEDLVRNQVDLTPEALQIAAGAVRTKLMERNMDKIIKHLESVITEKNNESWRQKIHNDTPLNNGAAPDGTEDLNTVALKQITGN